MATLDTHTMRHLATTAARALVLKMAEGAEACRTG
jgi:hypothetical protein